MRSKLCAFFRDFSQRPQTPDLKTTRVRQHRAVPPDEFMQSAACLDYVNAGPQPKVIGIAENDSRVEIRRLQFFKASAFDRTRSAHRHEDWGFNHPATSGKNRGARFAFLCLNLEIDRHDPNCLPQALPTLMPLNYSDWGREEIELFTQTILQVPQERKMQARFTA